MIILTASPDTISCIHLWLFTHMSQEKCFNAVPASERLMFQNGHLVPVASRNNKDDKLSHMKTCSCHVIIIIALFKKEKNLPLPLSMAAGSFFPYLF